MSLRTLVTLLTLMSAAWVACDEVADPIHDHSSHQSIPANVVPSGLSLFQLDSTWTNQQGQDITLRAFSGSVVVLAMVYTHCEAACPRIIADMRRIRAALGSLGEDVSLVLVSIDPERDDIDRLREFGDETGLSARGWTLLRGDETDVRELAAVVGLQYRKTSEADFAHSNIINVIDREGEIVHQQKGLGIDPKDTIEVIRRVLGESS